MHFPGIHVKKLRFTKSPVGAFVQIEIDHLAVVFCGKGMREHIPDLDFLLRDPIQSYLKGLLLSVESFRCSDKRRTP
jgi:hypothetical protein